MVLLLPETTKAGGVQRMQNIAHEAVASLLSLRSFQG